MENGEWHPGHAIRFFKGVDAQPGAAFVLMSKNVEWTFMPFTRRGFTVSPEITSGTSDRIFGMKETHSWSKHKFTHFLTSLVFVNGNDWRVTVTYIQLINEFPTSILFIGEGSRRQRLNESEKMPMDGLELATPSRDSRCRVFCHLLIAGCHFPRHWLFCGLRKSF